MNDETTSTAPVKVRRQGKGSVMSIITAIPREVATIDEDDEQIPASVTLAAPYAYYDDSDVLRSWAAGQVVADASDVSLLIERGAIFTE